MKFSKYISQQILFSSADNGDGEIRTLDPLLARQVLSQLSYAPILMGLSGLEPPTSRLSGVRSNQLSYKPSFVIRQPPAFPCRLQHSIIGRFGLDRRVRDGYGCVPEAHRHRNNLSSDVLLPCVSRTTFLTNLNLRLCSVSLSVHALITKQ